MGRFTQTQALRRVSVPQSLWTTPLIGVYVLSLGALIAACWRQPRISFIAYLVVVLGSSALLFWQRKNAVAQTRASGASALVGIRWNEKVAIAACVVAAAVNAIWVALEVATW